MRRPLLSAVTVWALCLTAYGAPQNETTASAGDKITLLAPSAQARSHYDMSMSVSAGIEQEQKFQLTVYRVVQEKKSDDMIVVSESDGPGRFGPQNPVSFLKIDDEAFDPQSSPLAGFAGPLARDQLVLPIDLTKTDGDAEWKSEARIDFPPLRAELTHKVTSRDGGRITVESKLAGEPTKTDFGADLTEWTRTVVFDTASQRPIQVESSVALSVPGPTPRSQTISVKVKETKQEPLSKADVAKLAAEAPALEAISKAAGKRLMTLMRGGEAGDADPKALIEAFTSKNKDGVLTAVAPKIGAWLADYEKGISEEIAARGAGDKLVGQVAPDFTLKDLDGKEVSLKDYRGKTVLLAFGAMGEDHVVRRLRTLASGKRSTAIRTSSSSRSTATTSRSGLCETS